MVLRPESVRKTSYTASGKYPFVFTFQSRYFVVLWQGALSFLREPGGGVSPPPPRPSGSADSMSFGRVSTLAPEYPHELIHTVDLSAHVSFCSPWGAAARPDPPALLWGAPAPQTPRIGGLPLPQSPRGRAGGRQGTTWGSSRCH